MNAAISRRRLTPMGALGIACAFIGAFTGYSANAQDFAITNATVATGDGSEATPASTVVVRGGRVVAAGPNVSVPAGIQSIDGTGQWVTPGIFAAMTDLGLWDVGAVGESNDTRAGSSPFGAALDVATSINPSSQHIAVSRAGGVTRASVTSSPTSSIFGGQGAVIDMGADADAVVRPRAFQFVALGERGARIAGGSRTSSEALLRNALREARDLGTSMGMDMSGGGGSGSVAIRGGPSSPAPVTTGDDLPYDFRLSPDGGARGSDVLLSRFDAAALVPVVIGEQPLYVHVERAADIRSVLALRDEFPRLDLVLVGVSEGWLAATDIAAAGVPVIADALDDLPSSFEQLAATQSNVGRMVAAGVRVAIGGLTDVEQPRNSPQYAGNLVALQQDTGRKRIELGPGIRDHHFRPGADRRVRRAVRRARTRRGRRCGDVGRRPAGTLLRPDAGVHRRGRSTARQPSDPLARPVSRSRRKRSAQGV